MSYMVAPAHPVDPPVFLQPRPLASYPGSFVLLPLLPKRPALKPLPSELWSKVFTFVFMGEQGRKVDATERRRVMRSNWKILFVCKRWMDIALPLLYAHVYVFSRSSLQKLVSHLYNSDQKWDSIRRIPYSTPGRWVQSLDVSELTTVDPSDGFRIDSLLTVLFPLLPSLTHLILNPGTMLSHRALNALRTKDGVEKLRTLKGLTFPPGKRRTLSPLDHDPVFELLLCCERLEDLELISTYDESHIAGTLDDYLGAAEAIPPLRFPNLHSLSLISVPFSATLQIFLNTPCPSLRSLLLTPFTSPSSIVPLLTNLGSTLTSLHLSTPLHHLTPAPVPVQTNVPTPILTHLPTQITPLLTLTPSLQHLFLDFPLPTFLLPLLPPGSSHRNLKILTIPRPNTGLLTEVETMSGLRGGDGLSGLKVVRMRSVRWLRKGVGGQALEAGYQGEMKRWRIRLGRRGVGVVDMDWKGPDV